MSSQAATVAIIGAGARGRGYARSVSGFPHLGEVVAVAEPRDDYRGELTEMHNIPSQNVFNDWQSFCEQPKLCDAVVISTMGREIRVHGTQAEARFGEGMIEIREFAGGNTETITIAPEAGGHGGGDTRVVLSWLRAIRESDPSLVTTDVHESLRTHEIVFTPKQGNPSASL